MPTDPSPVRDRTDRCPGLARPWIADDGALVRLRLLGGLLPRPALSALVGVAEAYGDGAVHLTRRANLQLRGLPHHREPAGAPNTGVVHPEVADAVRASGLVPAPDHELVRNYLLSPPVAATAASARADLRPVLADLDAAVCDSPALAGLSARFLTVLDDGRGDVVGRSCDLGLVALSADEAQLRIGDGWGPVVRLGDAAAALVDLAHAFVDARGTGPDAPWHVAELDAPLEGPLARPAPPDPRVPAPTGRPAYDAHHLAVPEGRLTRDTPLPGPGDLVVTPWRSVVGAEETT